MTGHGTAIVVLAALHNALAVTRREIGATSFVLAGAGAAGSATTRLLITAGADAERIVVCDSPGALHTGRDLDRREAVAGRAHQLRRRPGPARGSRRGDVVLTFRRGGHRTDWASGRS